MKVFVSLLTLIGLLMLLGVMTNEVYAPPPPNHYTAFEYAEHVLIGKILSVETLSEQKSQSSSDPNDVKGFMLYEIQIDEFLKNPLETNVIKVPGRYATEENPRSNIDPPYEINQKVLLYIQKDEPNRLPNYDLVIRSDESKVIDESISKPYFLSKSDGQVKHYFPLQQFQSGISFNEIQCKQNLVLIQKYDGMPACVTESTKTKLIERGWTKVWEPLPTDGYHTSNDRQGDANLYEEYRMLEKPESPVSNLSNQELRIELDKLSQSGLPISTRLIDYDLKRIVLYSPDLTIEDEISSILGDTPFVLLWEEAPPRWETGDPKPEPDPEPLPDSESSYQQRKQQAKLHVQEVVMLDTRGHDNKINAIRDYRDEFESDYFLEQFIIPNKQNFNKDDLMNFVYAEWGYQPKENTSSKVTVYFRSYDNYDKIEKINEWQRPKDHDVFLSSPDPDGYILMDLWGMPPATGIHETCTSPGEYRIAASNPDYESKVEWGYFTCQRDKLVGEPQPWMELPE